MRKRTSRPPRFAAVDNQAIDTLPSLLAVGLLTRLIRARDGDHVTVETLVKDYAEGETTLTRAMRQLVDGALVVKLKCQRARAEHTDDGVKRGGSWFTEFSVDSVPHTREDVAAMVDGLRADGTVSAVRVEPQHLDPRTTAPGSPTPGNRGAGATCGNAASSQVAPTRGFPTPGDGGALSKTALSKTEDSLSAGSHGADATAVAGPGDGEREEAPPDKTRDADAVAEAWAAECAKRGAVQTRQATAAVRRGAVKLLDEGEPVAMLTDAARDMARVDPRFRDLGQHLEHFVLAPPPVGQPTRQHARWEDCEHGCDRGWHGDRPARKCVCRGGSATGPALTAGAPADNAVDGPIEKSVRRGRRSGVPSPGR